MSVHHMSILFATFVTISNNTTISIITNESYNAKYIFQHQPQISAGAQETEPGKTGADPCYYPFQAGRAGDRNNQGATARRLC
ncbi:hypothetical protein D9M68_915510 [compost metagenome]